MSLSVEVRSQIQNIGPSSLRLLKNLAEACKEDSGVLEYGVTLDRLGERIYPGTSPGRRYRNMINLVACCQRTLDATPLGATAKLIVQKSRPLTQSRCIPNEAVFEYLKQVRPTS